MIVIPAMDIIGGKPVRLSQGDYARGKSYDADPIETAKAFLDAGLGRLHLVDLEGAKAGGPRNLATLERIKRETGIMIDYGGGIRTMEDLEAAFSAGADWVTCGSVAVRDPGEALRWIAKFGEKIILGADCRGTKVAAGAWAESSDLDVAPFIRKYEEAGVREVISTDISRDGMLAGPGLELYRKIMDETSVRLVASGGVSGKRDLETLSSMGLYGAIVGKAYYEGRISVKEMGEVNAC